MIVSFNHDFVVISKISILTRLMQWRDFTTSTSSVHFNGLQASEREESTE